MRHNISIVIAGVGDASGNVITWHAADGTWTPSQRYGTIFDLGAFAAQIEEGQSVSQSSVTSFTIVTDDLHSPIGQRAIDIFGVIGAEQLTAADVWATTGCTAGATTIVLAGGTAQTLSQPYLHVGTECVQVASTSIPASGSVTVTRGALHTLARPHRATGAGYLARTIPVTRRPTEWIGRRVEVLVDGALWRVGFLIENPVIQGNKIVFSYVSNENLVSIERSGDYVPAYGTTLAPASASLYSRIGGFANWRLFYSAPALRWAATAGHRNGLSHADIVSRDGSWVFNDSADAAKFVQLTYWDESETQGVNGYPRVNVLLSNRSAVGHSYALEADIATYFAYGGSDVEFELTFKQTTDYQSFLADDSAGLWYCEEFRVDSITTPTSSGFPAPGTETTGYGAVSPYGTIDMWSKFDWYITTSAVLCQNNASELVGYLHRPAAPHYCGIVSRRNARPGEDLSQNATANLFAGLAPLSSWGVYRSPNTPCEPDRRDPNESIYPIRPKGEAPLHTVYARNGCVLTCDLWPVTVHDREFAIDVDVASAWWEIGYAQIYTVAEVPGVTGTDPAAVTVTWTEPDGEEMSASAQLRRRSDSDYGSYYCYDISDVRLSDGTQCVGFGSWGDGVATITRPVDAGPRLGNIVPQIIASGDGTSGREFDTLGDGLGCPLTAAGATSLSIIQPAALDNLWWRFSPQIAKYSDFLRIAAFVGGKIIVGALHSDDPSAVYYGPETRNAGRPLAGEAVDSVSDDDIIGLPTSGGDGGLVYTSYRVTCGDTTVNVPDWLAADLIGQGEACEIDLTDIYTRPEAVTADAVASIVDQLRDRFGTLRRRWSMRVTIDRGLRWGVGDVLAVTSQHLIAATGEVGVTNALARIMSISHDFVGGTCDVELLAWASYGAGHSIAWDAYVSGYSSSTYTLHFNYQTGVDLLRAMLDQQGYSPDGSTSSYLFRMFIFKGPNAGRYVNGYFTSWTVTENGGTATFYSYSNGGPSQSYNYGRVMIVASSSRAAYADLFQVGRDRLL